MSAVVHVTDSSFAKEVLQADKPVLVDFWAPWCGPCRMIAPELERLADDMAGEITVAKVNVDENPAVAARYRIMSIPTMKLFHHGTELQTVVGFKTKDQLKQMIRNAR